MAVDGPMARFIRAGLTEEYSVSVDGVRQDFIVEQRPEGEGQLRVELDVTGARAEPLANGARLVLDGSGRKFAYTRLRAVDARGQELAVRLEVVSGILPDVEGGHPAARDAGMDCLTGLGQAGEEAAGLGSPALRQARMPAATGAASVLRAEAPWLPSAHRCPMLSGSGPAARPDPDPEALGGLDEDFAEQVFHAGGFGLVEPPREGECDREGDGGGGKEHRVTVPGDSKPDRRAGPNGINQQAPGDRRESEGDVADSRVDGEEVVAAHDGNDRHGEARVGHLDQRGQQTHHELQQQHDGQPHREHTAG